MSGGTQDHHSRAHEQQRAARHEVHNSLYAVELTTLAMVNTEAARDREELSRLISEEVARVRAVLPTLSQVVPSPDSSSRRPRKGES